MSRPAPLRLTALAPGHFHAALVHRRMHPAVHPRVAVYAPLDDDTLAHLARVAAYNHAPADPTVWDLDLHAGADFLDRFRRESPGGVVIVAGRNAPKLDLLRSAVAHGCHVLADKPWVITPAAHRRLADVLLDAESQQLVVADLMTERHEITAKLLRDLLRQPDVLGDLHPGTPAEPTLLLHSLHYLCKTVAGRPIRRPVWWFDPTVAGPALADVGTHLVDLALWLLFPGRPIDPAEIAVRTGRGWPTELNTRQFTALTGLTECPPQLRPWVSGGVLHYQGNGVTDFTVRGVPVRATVAWAVERGTTDPPEGNTITVRGTNAVLVAKSVATLTAADKPALTVIPTAPERRAGTADALRRWCDSRPERALGMRVEDRGPGFEVILPDRAVSDHEAHFLDVFDAFIHRVQSATAPPDPENLLAKYLVTTTAAELAGPPA